MKYFITAVLVFCSLYLNAQKTSSTVNTYKKALQVPDSLTKTSAGLANYITTNFLSQKERAGAIFVWITNNISYDIENAFAINFYANTNQIIEEVFRTRKGVCMHYAELFNDIATNSGLKSFVVNGYTKQNGLVDYIPHAWCAIMIDSAWSLIDPTWGSGYIRNARFVRQLNDYYFMTLPELLIKSHMPFDPLWEFLNYPVTNQEFYEGNFNINKNKPYFDYNDTLQKYINQTDIERLVSSTRRIELNGVRNPMIFDRLQHNKREIEYFIKKQEVDRMNESVAVFNEAVNLYNDGINRLNEFIRYRNNQFNPKKGDAEIQQMLLEPESLLNAARKKLNDIKYSDPNVAASILQLNKSLDEAAINLNEQKVFLNKYFNTSKVLRKSLFYKYTWMGFPL